MADQATNPVSTEPDPLNLRNRFVAGVLAILLPGLGHAYQRRWGKAILFFTLIGLLFWTGIGLGTYKSIYYRMDDREWRLEVFAQAFAGAWAWPALLPAGDLEAWHDSIDDLHRTRGRDMELARLFTLIAGLLNLLVIADAVDGPAYRKDELEYERNSSKGNAPPDPNLPANLASATCPAQSTSPGAS